MGIRIVKQPNGKFAMWSTIADDFVFEDATKKEYIEFRAKEAYEDMKEKLIKIFGKAEKLNFTNREHCKDYNDCLRIRKNNK